MEKRTKINHLKELNHSNYKIADNQPHIDDWKIVDRSDRKVGKVHDMLFDKDRMKVRYIITNLKDGDIMDEDRKVLIPIGQAQLNTNKKRVIVPNLTRDHLTRLPKYDNADNLTEEDETLILNTFSGTERTTSYNKDTFYDNDHFNEDKFYDHEKNNNMESRTTEKKVDVVEEDLEVGKKEVQTGGAKIKSRIVERPVEERVNLKEEHVEVKRKPVDKPAGKGDMDNFEEKTIEKTETKEVPVVNKEARVKEEVTLEKEVENKEAVIKDKVKETKVDIDKKSDKRKDKDAFASRKRSNTEKSDKSRF
jgi:stress response protein YsnF